MGQTRTFLVRQERFARIAPDMRDRPRAGILSGTTSTGSNGRGYIGCSPKRSCEACRISRSRSASAP